MFIVSVASRKLNWINDVNEINKAPFIGSILLGFGFMFPTLFMEIVVESIFGENPLFDLSFVFFLNTFCIHLFLKIAFDITIKFFFIPSLIWVLFLMGFHLFKEKEQLLQLIVL